MGEGSVVVSIAILLCIVPLGAQLHRQQCVINLQYYGAQHNDMGAGAKLAWGLGVLMPMG